MRGQFLLIGRDDLQRETAQVDLCRGSALRAFLRVVHDEQRILAAGQVDVDVGQQFCVQQGSVQRAARVVDAKAVTQCIQELRLPGYISLAMARVSVMLAT